MPKLRARGALCREAAGEGADFVAAADVDHRALEDRVYREAIDHGLDLAIVERAAIARKEIVDRCTIFEIAFGHSPSPWPGLSVPSPSAEYRNVDSPSLKYPRPNQFRSRTNYSVRVR